MAWIKRVNLSIFLSHSISPFFIRIVNQLNKDQFNVVKPYLLKTFDQSHIDDAVNAVKHHKMKDDTLIMYQSILDTL